MQGANELSVTELLVLQDLDEGSDPFLGCEAAFQHLRSLGFVEFAAETWTITAEGREACRAALRLKDASCL